MLPVYYGCSMYSLISWRGGWNQLGQSIEFLLYVRSSPPERGVLNTWHKGPLSATAAA